MPHLVLLGDSIFDNRVYVAPDADVADQLRARLDPRWKVTLLAVDGDVTADVRTRQLASVPRDADMLVISVGGNDALRHSSILADRVATVGEGVARLAAAQSAFADDYARMIDAAVGLGRMTAVCTIYDANYPDPQRGIVVAALAVFNDVIARAAFSRGLPLIDLRLICTDPADYANPIEPSAAGGDKIARAIAALAAGDAAGWTATVWR